MEHEVNLPEWLTVEFLNQCLQSKNKYGKSHVTGFSAEPAVPPGYNFGSNLLRVKVHYKEESKTECKPLSIIVKSPLTTSHLFFDDFYSSEPKFYNCFLPEAYKLLKFCFAPDSFFSSIPSVVVMEDLKVQGYKMAERSKQLDFEHCCSYVTAAATFHAMSFAVYKQNPDLIHSMSKEKMFSNDLESVKSTKLMIRYGLEHLADCVSALEINENCHEVLKDCSMTLWDMLVEAHKPNKVFNCINQGDPWTANMMFKYESEGKPSDIKMLDFQNLRYSSPACDLTFFIWSSANNEVREHHLQDLYDLYLSTLNSRLLDLNCSESLSCETFKDHILALSPMAIWTVATTLPLVLNPSPTDLNPLYAKLSSDYSNANNPFKEYYFESYKKTHLPQLVKQLKMTGVFDYLKSQQE